MADKKTRGRPALPDKMGIYSRIHRDLIAALDKIAEGMEPQPNRAQLIELAVKRFVEQSQHPPKK